MSTSVSPKLSESTAVNEAVKARMAPKPAVQAASVDITANPVAKIVFNPEAPPEERSRQIAALLCPELAEECKASIKQMEGPIGIARASGDAARQPGWTPLLSLMAMISLNLGIFNLLPIPILDGGIIMLLIIEAIMRRDISIRIKERIYQTAFVFLLLFFVVVIYNDLLKALPGLAQRLP